MSRRSMMSLALLVIVAIAAALLSPTVARADDRAAEAALKTLYQKTPEAKTLEDTAKGILVFPNIKKAGFIVGAQYGTGTLFEGGRPAGHYRMTAGSYGLQAGVQGFSYAMFFMTETRASISTTPRASRSASARASWWWTTPSCRSSKPRWPSSSATRGATAP